MVCCKGCLESVDSLDPLGQENSCVVDENMEFLVSGLEVVCQFADGILGREVRCHRVEISVTTLGSHLDERRFAFVLVARDYHDGSVQLGQSHRCGLAYSRIASGD